MPAVSFIDNTSAIGLGYAWYVGAGGNCSGNDAWSCTIIERDGNIKRYPSLVFTSSGSPVIAYTYGDSNPSLKFANYVGTDLGDCSSDNDWKCQVVDSNLQSEVADPRWH
ncbi:MAG: hypothetical protein MZV65_42100 [Chromatiales bacterium]|nr:hypothetical protein [Chromatiales bacterium]